MESASTCLGVYRKWCWEFIRTLCTPTGEQCTQRRFIYHLMHSKSYQYPLVDLVGQYLQSHSATPLCFCLLGCMLMYIPVFMLMYIPVFMLMYIPVFMLMYVPVFMLMYIPVFMLMYILVFKLMYVPVFMLMYVPVFVFIVFQFLQFREDAVCSVVIMTISVVIMVTPQDELHTVAGI